MQQNEQFLADVTNAPAEIFLRWYDTQEDDHTQHCVVNRLIPRCFAHLQPISTFGIADILVRHPPKMLFVLPDELILFVFKIQIELLLGCLVVA